MEKEQVEALVNEFLYGPPGAVGGLEGLTVALGGAKNQIQGVPQPIGASIEEGLENAGREIAEAIREGLTEVADAIRSLKND